MVAVFHSIHCCVAMAVLLRESVVVEGRYEGVLFVAGVAMASGMFTIPSFV